MVVVMTMLCFALVIQILKIVLKQNIIDKNLIDYYLEYMVTVVIAMTLFFQKQIATDILFTIFIISLLYEIISFLIYIRKESINKFSIKK